MRLVINPKFPFTRHMRLQWLSKTFSIWSSQANICAQIKCSTMLQSGRDEPRMTSSMNSMAYIPCALANISLIPLQFAPWFYRIYAVPFAVAKRPQFEFLWSCIHSIHSIRHRLSLHCCTLRIRDMWWPCCRSYFVIVQFSSVQFSSAQLNWAASGVSQCWHNVAKCYSPRIGACSRSCSCSSF